MTPKHDKEFIAHPSEVCVSPPRNCDIGTPEEQTKRFQKFCLAHNNCSKCDCPCNNNDGGCQIRWALLPFMEGVTK